MIYAMSDLHGCYDKYIKMLEKINFNDNDTLYILGDIVDRGPDGIKILQDIMTRKNVIVIRGNHDYSACKLLKMLCMPKDNDELERARSAYAFWRIDGGKPTYQSFVALDEKEQKKILAFMDSFLIYDEITVSGNTFFMSHTVPEKSRMLNFESLFCEEFIAGEPDYEEQYFDDKYIVTGHTPTGFIDPKYKGKIWCGNNHIAIDCGAVFGNPLGCICLDTLEEFYVEEINVNKKRAELHLHTKLSDDISVISVEEIFKKAENLELEAVAFTNLNNVQDFYKIARCAKKSNVKAIYGAEVFYENEKGICGQKLTLLAKNNEGIKELYKIISALENDGVCDLINLSVLKQNRKNLLVGSCGYDGELFCEIASGKDEKTVKELAAFYDYFEIFPARDEKEKEINKKIYSLGKQAGVPIVAASNAHYLLPQDSVCCDILRVSYGFSPQNEDHLHLRSTEQMLAEFDYLGKKAAEEVVINTPKVISDLICHTTPIKEGFYMVEYRDAYKQIKITAFNKAYQIYGNPLPQIIEERLNTELRLIETNGFASIYLIAYNLTKYVSDTDHYAGTRGATGSSLVTFLLNISNVNPLPPHYYCPNCQHFEQSDIAKDGFDLPKKECPWCVSRLKLDGHDIPYETFMGIDGAKMPDFDINISSDVKLSVIEYMQKHFDKSRVAMAGTVYSLTEYTVKRMIEKYEKEQGVSFSESERIKIIALLEGVKRDDGVHPGGIMTIPPNMEFEDFTPLKKNWAPIDATHFDFHNLHDTILKTDILCPNFVEVLESLQKMTGVRLEEIDITDPQIYEVFKTCKTEGILEFDTEFMRDLLIKTKPETFNDLVKINGLAHGTNVWVDNGEHLIKKGVPLCKLPALRDDIMNDLVGIGVDKTTAFRMNEIVRKGLIAKNKARQEDIDCLKEISKPLGDWYFDFCSKVCYMFPKAHAVSYVITALCCAWYKTYYPTEFYIACKDLY